MVLQTDSTFELVVSKLGAFIDPVSVLFVLMLSFIFVIVYGPSEWKRICAGFFGFFSFLYVLSLETQLSRGRVGMFRTSYVVFFLCSVSSVKMRGDYSLC